MLDEPRQAARTRNAIFIVSMIAWGPFVLMSRGNMLGDCGAMARSGLPNARSLAAWGLMVIAMMSPALIAPIRYIELRSFARRRLRSTMYFAVGYFAVWMAAGCLFLGAQSLPAVAGGSSLPVVLAALVAVVWQCSPAKQLCLNRCHAHVPFGAFGLAADLGKLRFGLIHGAWCFASCWAIMFAVLLLPRWHLVAMVAATVFIAGERLEAPRVPSWQPRGLGRTTRFLHWQMRSWRFSGISLRRLGPATSEFR
jgi:predicted metal-binding membrane protein